MIRTVRFRASLREKVVEGHGFRVSGGCCGVALGLYGFRVWGLCFGV